jgi:hypothetical protein
MGWVVNTTPRPVYPRERPGTHFIGGLVGLRASVDGCGNSRLHRDSHHTPAVPVVVLGQLIFLYYFHFDKKNKQIPKHMRHN